MKVLARYALTIVAATLFGGCGASQPPIGSSRVLPQTSGTSPGPAIEHHIGSFSSAYQVLYRFGSGSDGKNPNAGLIGVKGMLYGTTFYGGTHNEGTVFRITTNGTEKVVYGFSGRPDGQWPYASLLDVKGDLYGTTLYGGKYFKYSSEHGGTAFSSTKAGKERVLHSFGSGQDGEEPSASLIDVQGTLYGTTALGGAHNEGTVFSLTATGTEHVMHSFAGGSDGKYPTANLIDVKGVLYSTTDSGGAYGQGTVFTITTSGTEKILYSFGSKYHDGAAPYASLIDVNGKLYSTTFYGGAHGGGTVFSISTSGQERVLHSFGSGHDGAAPYSKLIDVNGTLYSTTTSGGAHGGGTIFSIRPTGNEQVLHSFGGGQDGRQPAAGLIDANGTLYGTTYIGGGNGCNGVGCGIVFALKP